ncbi:MAG: sensor histidine kinase [Caulobacterales bacterium]
MHDPSAPATGTGDGVADDPPSRPWYLRLVNSLAGRLLGLTVLLVLLAEVMVFAPSVARFHVSWIEDRINLAQVAALAASVDPGGPIAEMLLEDLRVQGGVLRIAGAGGVPIVLSPQPARSIDHIWDFRGASAWDHAVWAVDTLFSAPGRVILVRTTAPSAAGRVLDVTLDESLLRHATRRYGAEVAIGSTLVSVLAGALVYLVLIIAFVRPMRRLTRNVERFRRRPSDVARTMPISRRRDEIGRAERAIRALQSEIQASLRQRERLAELGGAMARVAHDLRNMLATAQLVTERIATSSDPDVRAAAPRLERAIGRAAGLAASALRYGRADEVRAVLQAIVLEDVVREALADTLSGFADVKGVVTPQMAMRVIADGDQLHRLLSNLIRNAAQAVRAASAQDPDHPMTITVSAQQVGAKAVVRIADTGGGMPAQAIERLFEPFAASRPGGEGSGLGLAIARELARGQGGDLVLESTGSTGTVFLLTLQTA